MFTTSVAPAKDRFPTHPASWYLFGTSAQMRQAPVTKRIVDRDLVAYRTASGQVIVMDARCSHLGADLGRGRIVGDCLECPFHSWQYSADGRCVSIPGSVEIPAFARQQVYPTVERHNLVFFFNGREPSFPLPFFFGEAIDDFVAGRPQSFVANCTWSMVAAHGYDVQHFDSVHARRLIAPPVVDCPTPFARRCSYTAEVVGNTIWDRLLRKFAGRMVDITITTWGGTIVVLTGAFSGAHSYFMIATQPLPNDQTLCEVFVFCKRHGRNRLTRLFWEPVSLWVRGLFTRGYLVDEVNSLGNPQYNPHTLIPADREMSEYFRWVSELPQSPRSLVASIAPEPNDDQAFAGEYCPDSNHSHPCCPSGKELQ